MYIGIGSLAFDAYMINIIISKIFLHIKPLYNAVYSVLIIQVVKRFHRNQNHVGMAVVNKVRKQVRISSQP